MVRYIKDHKIFLAAGFLVLIVLTFILGMVVQSQFYKNDSRNLQNKYNLLAKRVLIDNPNDILLDFSNLEGQLEQYTNQYPSGTVSLYFEYLPTGTSIGINEKQELAGASLLKTPLAINLYKAASEGKVDLDKTISLKKEWLNDQYGDLYKKGEGYNITLRQAAEIMLTQSDNTAALAIYNSLADVVPIDKQLLSFIDVEYGINQDSSVRLGPETYSSILKCLYFSCYLNKDESQEILDYLSKSKADNRLKLFLPNDIVVAHKIGVYDTTETTQVQSDCGVFYISNRNYLLCVMVKGDEQYASRIIGDVSKLTYDFITKNSDKISR